MTDLRDMQILAALARQKHFARAAEECGISQPAFSARIRNLEKSMGLPLVKRGNRFLGFTREGEVALKWARQLLDDVEGLNQDIKAARGIHEGQLIIGAVPTALAYVSRLTATLHDHHPCLRIQLYSMSASEIRRGLDEFTLHAGVSYLRDHETANLSTQMLYEESYVLLSPPHFVPKDRDIITWAEAAQLPLCLLTQNMQNRRIIDAIFEKVGVEAHPVLETNAFTVALTQVSSGVAATIAPEALAESVSLGKTTRKLQLVEPTLANPIGILTLDRDPVPPALKAFLEIANK